MRRPACLLLAAAALLAGCGGEGGGDEDEITAMIEASARTTGPAACTLYYTQDLLEQSTKLRGEAAVSACEEDLRDEPSPSDAVVVSQLEVDGEEGSADVAYRGGPFDGQTVRYALAHRDGAWKLDQMVAFPVFDRKAMLRESARAAYDRSHTPAELDATACGVERLRELSDAALQELLLSRSPQPLLDIAKACEPSSASA